MRTAVTNSPAQVVRKQRTQTAKAILAGWKSVQGCGCRMIDPTAGVRVIGNSTSGSHQIRFVGVRRCSSIWHCPECAATISEVRANELISGVNAWRAKGNAVIMSTYTFPHGKGDCLVDMMEALKTAYKSLRESGTFKQAQKDLKVSGSVRALEVTVGSVNGWHPHYHVLEFISGEISQAEIEAYRAAVLDVWQSSCVSAGLAEPSAERGLDIVQGTTVGEKIAEYMAKHGHQPKSNWGAEKEIAKGSTKTVKPSIAGGARFSPFALLDEFRETENEKYRRWFLEYACAFRHQRQIVWSRGLKALLGSLGAFTDSDDDQVAAEPLEQEGDFVIATIQPRDWMLLARHGLIPNLRLTLQRSPSPYVVAAFIYAGHVAHRNKYSEARILALVPLIVDETQRVIAAQASTSMPAAIFDEVVGTFTEPGYEDRRERYLDRSISRVKNIHTNLAEANQA